MGELKGSQRKYLRGAAHSYKPIVQIGKEGLSESVIRAIDNALEAHELIKVKMAAERDEREQFVPLIEALESKEEASGLFVLGMLDLAGRVAHSINNPLGALMGQIAFQAGMSQRLFATAYAWLGQLSAVAYFLLLRLDQGMLEYYRGAAEVGIYSIAVYVGEMLWLLPGALTPLLVHSSSASADDPARDRNAARASETRKVADAMRGWLDEQRRADEDLEICILGDFNCTPWNRAFPAMLEATAFARLGGLMMTIMALSLGAGIASLISAGVLQWAKTVPNIELPLIGVVAPWQFTFIVVGLPVRCTTTTCSTQSAPSTAVSTEGLSAKGSPFR